MRVDVWWGALEVQHQESHVRRHTSHVTRHTSHVTRRTSRIMYHVSRIPHLTSKLQEADAQADAPTGTSSHAPVSFDTGGSGGLYEPMRKPPVGLAEGGQPRGRLERSNSADSNSSEGMGFNARDGSGL